MIVPEVLRGLILTTIVKVADPPFGKSASVAVAVPAPPTGGLTRAKDGPVFCTNETKVVFSGTASLSTVFAAAPPVLVNVIV